MNSVRGLGLLARAIDHFAASSVGILLPSRTSASNHSRSCTGLEVSAGPEEKSLDSDGPCGPTVAHDC